MTTDLFDWMDEAEIKALDQGPPNLPAVVDAAEAVVVEDARLRRLSDAGLMRAIGITIDDSVSPEETTALQMAFLQHFVVGPILSGMRLVTIRLDAVVGWCRTSFGSDGDTRDWSTSPEFRFLDRYLVRLEQDGILRLAVNRVDYAVKETIVALFQGEPQPERVQLYWWEMLGCDIRADLHGNGSVVAHEINSALARVDDHWRAFELEECVECARLAWEAGKEIETSNEEGLLFHLEVLFNWLSFEVWRRDNGGERWDPYADGIGPTPADKIHHRYFDEDGTVRREG